MNELYTIDQIKKTVGKVAARHGALRVCLFGSYARGAAHPGSDVDLLVDRGNMRGLFALSAFCSDLEESLGCPVDMVTTDARDQAFLQKIHADEVLLYDADK